MTRISPTKFSLLEWSNRQVPIQSTPSTPPERVSILWAMCLALLLFSWGCTTQDVPYPVSAYNPTGDQDVSTNASGNSFDQMDQDILTMVHTDVDVGIKSDLSTRGDGTLPDRGMLSCQNTDVTSRDCGINNRGSQPYRCSEGTWVVAGDCIDGDACADNSEETRECEAPNQNSQTRTCLEGQWTSWTACEDPEVTCEGAICGTDCIDLQTNTNHCGRCDNVCAADSECCDGACVRQIFGEAPPLAIVGACGSLRYGVYAAQGETEAVHRIPDFSYAGYMGGGVAIPDVPVRISLSPAEGDDRARIQNAIDTVEALTPDDQGIRGAVLLAAGRYEVDGTIVISKSGTVLRGSGQGASGTVIVATKREKHELIRLQGDASGFGEQASTRADIQSEYVPVGSRTLRVTDNVVFNPGDTIAVFRTPNQAWIDHLSMDRWGWTPNAYHIGHERQISDVEGTDITVDIPFVDTIDTRFGGGIIFKSDMSRRLQKTGVEDLRLVSEYETETDENHAWDGIILTRTSNSWVRRVTTQYFGYSAVTIRDESSFNTIEEVAMLDPKSEVAGGRRYAFNLVDGVGNLFQRCYARSGRHNFVSGARTTGPNVWLDCLAENPLSDEGPHHRWATGLLFDNIKSRDINVQNRTNSGTGHGWAGAQTLFWNVEAQRIICDSPRGAMNYVVGSVGEPTESRYAPDEASCFQISPNEPVTPRSLYLQQLADRLGSAAVENITTPTQRNGRIWLQLSAWAGE